MGVLGDDDIEKIEQARTKARIGKIFYDPKRAYNFWVNTMLVWLLGFIIFGLVIVAIDWTRSNDLLVVITDNVDCGSMIRMYQDLKHNDGFILTKETLKDEIAFRC